MIKLGAIETVRRNFIDYVNIQLHKIMAYHMSELPRSIKPFGYTPYGEGHPTSISYASDVTPDNINFQPSVGIHELLVHKPEFLENGKNCKAIGNTNNSFE